MLWRTVLHNWIQQKAREKVYETMSQATQAQAAAAHPAEQPRGPPPPCDVGLVFALGVELGGLEDLLSGVRLTRGAGFVVRQGGLKGRSVVLVESGMGCAAAARGAEALVAGHRPAWVLSSGFAGGLDPRLARGDIVLADSVANAAGQRLAIDLKVSPNSLTSTPRLHVGRLLTTEAIISRAAEKRALGQEHGALAVDMESWAVGEVCRQAKVRFMAVRIVTDAVDDELPPDVERLARQKTTAARLGAAAGAIFRRPSSLKDMLKLKEEALVASDRLARFLAGMIVQIVPEKEGTASP